jgi:L-ascorbate metabolism protein UlaG (beta-lactamase superfamily)
VSVELRWLGQAGFELRADGRTVLVDPFLAPHPDRLVPPAFEPAEAREVTAILCTHEHWDHLDPDALPALAGASPDAEIVVPEPIADLAPSGRARRARAGQALALDGVTVHPVPACHAVAAGDGYSLGDGRFLGYVLELGGVRVYHAGDTIPFDGLERTVAALEPDVALLPINGRDPEREARGIAGNLDEREAAHVADAVGVDVAVPMHYDMFAGNPGDPGAFVNVVHRERLRFTAVVMSHERPLVYAGRAA